VVVRNKVLGVPPLLWQSWGRAGCTLCDVSMGGHASSLCSCGWSGTRICGCVHHCSQYFHSVLSSSVIFGGPLFGWGVNCPVSLPLLLICLGSEGRVCVVVSSLLGQVVALWMHENVVFGGGQAHVCELEWLWRRCGDGVWGSV